MNPLLLKLIFYAVAVAAGATAGALGARIYYLGEISEIELGWQKLATEAAQESADAEKSARDTEHKLQAKVDEQEKGLADAKRDNQKLAGEVVRARVDAIESDRMRSQLQDFASARNAPGDSVESSTARSRTLATLLAESSDLLAEGVELAAEAARSNDDRAAEVEALVKAWPM